MLQLKNIDWMITLLPLLVISLLSALFFIFPEQSNIMLSSARFFFGNTLGAYYIIIALTMFFTSLYLCISDYGNIVLGEKNEKPKYSFRSWGTMMFTCGLAADILFYSLSEWIMYAASPHVAKLGGIQDWAGVFSLFHWGFIPWSFYLVLAVAFGFMLHVRNTKRQRFSEACRAILGRHTEGILGRIIDLLAIFALLAGTATTFSVATPLMSIIIQTLFHISINRTYITICIIVLTCLIYTYSLLHGIKGISILAKTCVYLLGGLLFFVLILGGESRYIIETGIESFGTMMQNFITLATYTDPLRTTNFPQDWTVYYWAYWIAWCVAAPLFIGNISRGRNIRQVITGGYIFGTGSTLMCFIILGNYGLGLQTSGTMDFITQYAISGDIYSTIISILLTMPFAKPVVFCLLIVMILFYATSFDSIAYIAACYSYRKLDADKTPHKSIQLLWCVLLILLPIALVFSDSSMNNIQAVSIIAAFPLAVVLLMIILSFWKDMNKYLHEEKPS